MILHTLEPSSAVHKSWVAGETYCSFSLDWLISIYDLFHISFHHSNWLTVALLSQQILKVLSAFCCHSWASPTWPVGFLYDPMFFEFVQLILYLLFQCIGNSRRFLKCGLCIASHDNMGLKALHTSQLTILYIYSFKWLTGSPLGKQNISPHSNTNGSVGWASGCHAGGPEFDSSLNITQGLKTTQEKELPLRFHLHMVRLSSLLG